MKERIGKALSERLKEDPHNEWLQRKESQVHRAQITTIHGFCLYVIRNYFLPMVFLNDLMGNVLL